MPRGGLTGPPRPPAGGVKFVLYCGCGSGGRIKKPKGFLPLRASRVRARCKLLLLSQLVEPGGGSHPASGYHHKKAPSVVDSPISWQARSPIFWHKIHFSSFTSIHSGWL